MNEVVWNKRTLEEIRCFAEEVKDEIGFLLYRLQIGEVLKMPHVRPMPSIAQGCYELRVRDSAGIYRVFYYQKVKGKILIFHAFTKKTEKTSLRDIAVGKNNLWEMLNEEK